MKKTSKAEFNRFKKEFLRWMEILSVKGFKPYFFHESLDGNYASITVNESGKACNVSYALELSKVDEEHTDGPEFHARHEAIHLFLNKIQYLGEERFTASGEIKNEGERLVRILEKVL